MADRRVIVVGGGPAGLIAAGRAAQHGADTLLLEKMERPGRKLRITGKGRCNLTNVAPLSEFIAHFGPDGRFLRQAFHRFFTADLIALLDSLDVHTVTERGGRVFPASGQAREVVDALVGWVRAQGVALQTRSPVDQLIIEGRQITGVRVRRNRGAEEKPDLSPSEQIYHADAVIVARFAAGEYRAGRGGRPIRDRRVLPARGPWLDHAGVSSIEKNGRIAGLEGFVRLPDRLPRPLARARALIVAGRRKKVVLGGRGQRNQQKNQQRNRVTGGFHGKTSHLDSGYYCNTRFTDERPQGQIVPNHG